MISSMSVPICNCFHATRDNCGKKHLIGGSRLWRPPAPASLNIEGRDLDCLNLRWMLKLSCAGYPGLSLAISSQFSVEMCAASNNCKKFTKTPFLGVQGRSRSSMLINLKSLSPVLVIIGSMFVPVYNRFYTILANNGKITSFRGGYSSLTPSFERISRTHGHEILSWKTRDLEAAHGEDFVILACTVLIQITSVTHGRTPRPWLRRAKHSAIARKKERKKKKKGSGEEKEGRGRLQLKKNFFSIFIFLLTTFLRVSF